MSDDWKLIITGTFAIIALAWVATNAGPLGTFTQSAASAYGTATKSLLPSSS